MRGLIATGRRAHVDGLNLDAARIRHTASGITIRRSLRTSNHRVYAIGDVAGGPQFTHVASYHASLVIRALLFRLPVRVDPAIIPRVTFTDPQVAAAAFNRPLPDLGPPVATLDFDATTLGDVRRAVAQQAAYAGMEPERRTALHDAVAEVAANSVAHGGGRGRRVAAGNG